MDSRSTQPTHTTRFIETSRGTLSYAQLAPLLAERVRALEASISEGEFAAWTLDEALLLELHRRMIADLLPKWAGRWRTVDVTVSQHTPPPSYQVPMLMRDYGADLQARWAAVSSGTETLLLEFLAFAEGRFLSIHPFPDFNGRVIRVFLSELLLRLDLPPVPVLPENNAEKQAYFTALNHADKNDYAPLISIWGKRLSAE